MMMKRTITAAIITAALTGCTTGGTAVRDPHAPTTSTAVAAPLSTETTAPAAQTPGLRDDAIAPTVSIIETAPGAVNSVIQQALSDMIDFWEAADPSFTAPPRLEALGGAIPQSECMARLTTARRCDGGVGWSVPKMTAVSEASGDLGVLTIVAHEIGHEVQDDNNLRDAERGADCLAGVYLQHVADGSSERFVGSQSDILNAAELAFDEIKGEKTAPTVDRMSALRNGIQRSADFCLVKYR